MFIDGNGHFPVHGVHDGIMALSCQGHAHGGRQQKVPHGLFGRIRGLEQVLFKIFVDGGNGLFNIRFVRGDHHVVE